MPQHPEISAPERIKNRLHHQHRLRQLNDMAKPTAKTQPATVKTLAELARFAGVSQRTASTWKATSGFPVEPDGTYSPWRVAQWHAMRGIQIEPELAGPVSPALERWREERATMAKLERLQMEKQLCSRGWMHEQLAGMAIVLRRLGEDLQREYGDDVLKIFDDSLDEFNQRVERLVTDDEQTTKGSE